MMIQPDRWMRRQHTKNRIKEQQTVLSFAKTTYELLPDQISTDGWKEFGSATSQEPERDRASGDGLWSGGGNRQVPAGLRMLAGGGGGNNGYKGEDQQAGDEFSGDG